MAAAAGGGGDVDGEERPRRKRRKRRRREKERERVRWREGREKKKRYKLWQHVAYILKRTTYDSITRLSNAHTQRYPHEKVKVGACWVR